MELASRTAGGTPWQRRGGCAHQEDVAKPPWRGADGREEQARQRAASTIVRSSHCLLLELERTTPSALSKNGDIFLMRGHPSFAKEGSFAFQRPPPMSKLQSAPKGRIDRPWGGLRRLGF